MIAPAFGGETLRNPLICIDCHSALRSSESSLDCGGCGASFPIVEGIADFARGAYYDSFDPARDQLTAGHLAGLELEMQGSVRRINDFYIPLMGRAARGAQKVLDAGCGNGVSVDTLATAGFDAWGNDLSQLRMFQWRERASRERLIVASALRLPFESDYFDVVISSGVIEHIGVVETSPPHYSVRPVPEQRELRIAYLRELGRVVAPGGTIFIDCPNGSFPIDFWHGKSPGSPRFHSPREPFLPSFGEVRSLARAALGRVDLCAHSPLGRLQFRQSAAHLHGRLLRLPFATLFRLMTVPPFRWIAKTGLNPFLVVEITKGSQQRL